LSLFCRSLSSPVPERQEQDHQTDREYDRESGPVLSSLERRERGVTTGQFTFSAKCDSGWVFHGTLDNPVYDTEIQDHCGLALNVIGRMVPSVGSGA